VTKDQIKEGDYCTYKGTKCTFSKTPTGFDLQPIDPSKDIGHGIGIRHTLTDDDFKELTDFEPRIK
jgi:hypothetical protein